MKATLPLQYEIKQARDTFAALSTGTAIRLDAHIPAAYWDLPVRHAAV